MHYSRFPSTYWQTSSWCGDDGVWWSPSLSSSSSSSSSLPNERMKMSERKNDWATRPIERTKGNETNPNEWLLPSFEVRLWCSWFGGAGLEKSWVRWRSCCGGRRQTGGNALAHTCQSCSCFQACCFVCLCVFVFLCCCVFVFCACVCVVCACACVRPSIHPSDTRSERVEQHSLGLLASPASVSIWLVVTV